MALMRLSCLALVRWYLFSWGSCIASLSLWWYVRPLYGSLTVYLVPSSTTWSIVWRVRRSLLVRSADSLTSSAASPWGIDICQVDVSGGLGSQLRLSLSWTWTFDTLCFTWHLPFHLRVFWGTCQGAWSLFSAALLWCPPQMAIYLSRVLVAVEAGAIDLLSLRYDEHHRRRRWSHPD